tara:strand:- start:6605 stop:7963 length:1359 start_codon:yes stop_codon:yes gene_type:complete
LGIATYERPYDLKQRRENLSLDDGPAEEIIGAKGNVLAGLMAPTGGGSSEPERTFVGPQPEFEGLNEDEKSAMWELEKIGYKSRLEKLTGMVDDIDDDVPEIIGKPKIKRIKSNDFEPIVKKSNKSNGSRINLKRLTEEDRMQQNQLRNKKVNIRDIEEATSLSGLSPTYLTSNRQEYVPPEYAQPVDNEHETNITFDEWNYLHSGRQYKDTPQNEVVKAKDNYLKYKNRVEKKADYLTDNVTKQKGTSSEWLIGLKNIITKGEADSYDTISRLHKNKPPKRLTEMTVAEVKKWMVQEIGNKADSTSSGQYQINYVNLKELTDRDYLRDNELFNKDTQDKAYRQLLKKRGFDKFEKHMKMSGVQDPSGVKELSDKKVKAAIAMQLGLAQEWAAIPIPYDLTKEQRGKNKEGKWRYPNGLKKGQSYYEGKNNTVPRVNKGVDFLNYLLSYMEI